MYIITKAFMAGRCGGGDRRRRRALRVSGVLFDIVPFPSTLFFESSSLPSLSGFTSDMEALASKELGMNSSEARQRGPTL